ncbi:MAG: DUF4065 domain-containing protein [Clostridiales bacterium]|mgnify:CR=1 FL=1|nr:DUF4065 domain-containing protein [Clostridiales bacterium]
MKKGYCDVCGKKTSYTVKKNQITEFKGYEVNVIEEVGVCDLCSSNVYIPELESQNFKRLYGKYRKLAGLISPDELIEFRKRYDISQRELTAILKLGKMTINRYERGAVPSKSNSDYLKLIMNNSEVFKNSLNEAFKKERITQKTYDKVLGKINSSLEDPFKKATISSLTHEADEYNGYRTFDIERLLNLISYIADRVDLHKTSLNKYLWYIDFQSFKINVRSVTGLRYIKHQFGPVIEGKKYEEILNYFDEKFYKEEFEDGDFLKTTVKSKKNYDLSLFKKEELEVIDSVISTFKSKKSNEISELSHKEEGWASSNPGDMISYEYAEKIKIPF